MQKSNLTQDTVWKLVVYWPSFTFRKHSHYGFVVLKLAVFFKNSLNIHFPSALTSNFGSYQMTALYCQAFSCSSFTTTHSTCAHLSIISFPWINYKWRDVKIPNSSAKALIVANHEMKSGAPNSVRIENLKGAWIAKGMHNVF